MQQKRQLNCNSASPFLPSSSPPCRLPVTAVCGPFHRAALNVTAPPLSYSRLLLPLSSAVRDVSARLPSAAAVRSSRRSAARKAAGDAQLSGGHSRPRRLLGLTAVLWQWSAGLEDRAECWA